MIITFFSIDYFDTVLAHQIALDEKLTNIVDLLGNTTAASGNIPVATSEKLLEPAIGLQNTRTMDTMARQLSPFWRSTESAVQNVSNIMLKVAPAAVLMTFNVTGLNEKTALPEEICRLIDGGLYC